MAGHRILRLKLMTTVIRKTNVEQSKHWSQQLDSPLKDKKVGLLWREEEVNLSNNFYSAMGQLNSLERRLQKDDMLRKSYRETIEADVKTGYDGKVQQVELNETIDKFQLYLPHYPVFSAHKPKKVRRMCNSAAKYQGVALNDKHLFGPDLF